MLAPALALVALVLAATPASGARSDVESDAGVFDTICEFSHTLKDDPLLYPRKPGQSHVHDFYGNRLTDAYATGESLLSAGKTDHEITTCRDAADFSGYWTPALYRDDEKVDPFHAHAYYRNATPDDAVPFPVGFGMIAGDPHAMEPNEHVYWRCTEPPFHFSRTKVPDCENGDIFGVVTFPRCWNGVDLFKADQSHVSYAPCRPPYVVRLPAIIFSVRFPSDHQQHDYRLASGDPMTLHADFFNAWSPKALTLLVTKCLNERDDQGKRRVCEHDRDFPPQCSDFLDDDSDFKRDFPADPDCSSPADDSEYAGTAPQCSDRKDNDGDGKTDDREDAGCAGRDDDSERDVVMPQCSDGRDNDRDAKIDYPADSRCAGRPDDSE